MSKKMKKKQKARLMLFAGMAAILVVIIAIIILLIVKSNKKLETLSLTPTFSETELDVNKDYAFMITANPDGAKLKKLVFNVDDETALFEASNTSSDTAVLHTGAEGTLTVYVKQGDVVSNYLSFSVVDLSAKAEEMAKAQAEAEAQAEQAELEAQIAEEEANKPVYIRAIDTPRVRTSPNTDNTDNVIGKLTVGDVFERISDADGWSQIRFKDQDAYVSSDYVEVITEEEYLAAQSGNANNDTENTDNNNNNTANNNNNNDNNNNNNNNQQAQQQQQPTAEQAAANQAAIEAAKAQAAAQAQAEAEAAAQAAAAQAAMGTTIHCTDGACLVNAAQLQKIHATWDFAGDAVEMAGHHSIGELEAVLGSSVTRL